MAGIYLDTDCILALIKESDRLKSHVENAVDRDKKHYTSVLTVIECKLVISREYQREKMHDLHVRIMDHNIELLPVDHHVERVSDQLLKKYDFLGIFDSIHAATAIIHGLKILSTDHIFPLVEEVSVDDPRDIS